MPAAPHSRRSYRWIGFFVVLAVLAVFAILVPLAFNLSLQLRPEQVIEAQKRWQENAIPNYDLEYLIRTTHDNQEEELAYLVQVRDEQVVLVVCDNDVVYLGPSLALAAGLSAPALSTEDPRKYGISALFDEIEAALHQDEISERRSFATAQFDPKDGHPFHYVHRIRATRERVEWNIKITRISSP